MHEKVFFKFVIGEKNYSEDLVEVISIIKNFGIKNERIILMPEGTEINSQINNKWLHDECLKYGFRYSPRLHILLFGNLRGN